MLAKDMERKYDSVRVEGRFIGENEGRWKVMNNMMQEVGPDIEMYNWYGLKQRVSELINEIIAEFFDRPTA